MSNTIYVNVDGTWKTATNYYVNVGGTWKTGSEFQINVSGTWKGGAATGGGLPTTAQVLSLDYLDFSLPSIGAIDTKSTVDSLSLDLLDFSLPVAGKAYLGAAALVIVSTNLKLHLDAGDSTSYGGSGTTWSDLTSEDNDGTISGATYSSSDGGIFDFDGTDDYVSVDSSSDLTFGTGDFTVECWVKPDDFGSRGTFYDSRPSNGNTGITIGHESSSGEIRVYMTATSGSDIVVQSSDFETGEWQHIAVTRSSGTVTLFINGVSKDTGTRTTDLNNTNAVNIGYKTYTSSTYNYFNGGIAQVRVYKGTGLTSTQVLQNYNATKSTFGL
jgi:hypothetical protein